MAEAKELGAPYELVRQVAETGKLPVPNFAAGGIATPADAALMMQLGAEAVFVGSGIFKSEDPAPRAKAIVRATTHWQGRRGRGRGLARPRRGHARPRDREDPRGRAARDAGLVMTRRVGVLALQGDFAAHAAAFRDLGIEAREVRRVPRARRPRRPGDPRRREHDAAQPDARRAVVRGARAPSTRRAASSPAPAPARSCSRARCARASRASACSTP